MTPRLIRSSAEPLIVGTLVGLLKEIFPELAEPVDTGGIDSIRRLGLASLVLLEFMLAIEEEFGFEWDDHVEVEVLQSFDALADYVIEQSPRFT